VDQWTIRLIISCVTFLAAIFMLRGALHKVSAGGGFFLKVKLPFGASMVFGGAKEPKHLALMVSTASDEPAAKEPQLEQKDERGTLPASEQIVRAAEGAGGQ
jgi:hypothetical protein